MKHGGGEFTQRSTPSMEPKGNSPVRQGWACDSFPTRGFSRETHPWRFGNSSDREAPAGSAGRPGCPGERRDRPCGEVCPDVPNILDESIRGAERAMCETLQNGRTALVANFVSLRSARDMGHLLPAELPMQILLLRGHATPPCVARAALIPNSARSESRNCCASLFIHSE